MAASAICASSSLIRESRSANCFLYAFASTSLPAPASAPASLVCLPCVSCWLACCCDVCCSCRFVPCCVCVPFCSPSISRPFYPGRRRAPAVPIDHGRSIFGCHKLRATEGRTTLKACLLPQNELNDAFLITYNGQRHATEYCTAPKTSAEVHLPLGFLVQQYPQLRDGLGGCSSSGKRNWQVSSIQQKAEGG